MDISEQAKNLIIAGDVEGIRELAKQNNLQELLYIAGTSTHQRAFYGGDKKADVEGNP